MSDELSKMSQENILTLLVFDDKSCSLLSTIDVRLFGSDIYRNIASQAIEYYKVWKKPVGSHLPDILENYILGKDEKKAEIYKRVLVNLNENKNTVNKDYVLHSLEGFLEGQNLKLGICNAYDKIQEGDREGAKKELLNSIKPLILTAFNTGIVFNSDNILDIVSQDETEDIIITGIKELDENLICPAPKEQFTIFSLPNVGKSFFLKYLGKMAALQGKKVLHISLEMSEQKVCRRYLQLFFAIGKRRANVQSHLLFNNTTDGKFFNVEDYKPDVVSFDDKNIKEVVQQCMKDFKKINLIVKEFPTGFLTIDLLKRYLDSLELSTGFIPDVLLIDYPDLMRIDSTNLRTDIGRIFIDLRGIAVERNLANVNVTQCNRTGESAKVLTRKHLAEDYSKIMTADNALSLNQTYEEYTKGLMRIFVDKGRNEKKGDLIIISQNLSIGQPVICSARMSRSYQSYIKEGGGTCHDNETSND